MIEGTKLSWLGPEAWPGEEQEQARSKARAGQKHEQGMNRAGAELSRVKLSRSGRGQELGRNWGRARNLQDRSLKCCIGNAFIFWLIQALFSCWKC